MDYRLMNAAQRTEQRFCVFSTPAFGFRALGIVLLNYARKHGLNTIRGITSRFAPSNENNTVAYIKAVCDGVGRESDAVLDLCDPTMLKALMRAIATHEGGGWFFTEQDLEDGAALALKQET